MNSSAGDLLRIELAGMGERLGALAEQFHEAASVAWSNAQELIAAAEEFYLAGETEAAALAEAEAELKLQIKAENIEAMEQAQRRFPVRGAFP